MAKTTDGGVEYFEAGDSREENVELQYDRGGYYWASCSYAVDSFVFTAFVRRVKEIAANLDMLIQDPQLQNDPASFCYQDEGYEATLASRFVSVKKTLEKFSKYPPSALPATGRFFILLSITSRDPETGKDVLLTSASGRLYASKVEAGESIEQVVKREMPELTGSSEFSIINVFRSDTAKDRLGNVLPRHMVVIRVPYFYPKDRNVVKEVEWRALDRFADT